MRKKRTKSVFERIERKQNEMYQMLYQQNIKINGILANQDKIEFIDETDKIMIEKPQGKIYSKNKKGSWDLFKSVKAYLKQRRIK